MSTIDPYALLGVTVNSSLQELKRNYYDLAMLMHPDRSGTDSTQEMIILKNAYNFVKNEIAKTNTTITFEDLEESFKNFCKVQEESIPDFREIHDDRFDVHIFNDRFNQNFEQITNDGYGDIMEKSEYVTSELNEDKPLQDEDMNVEYREDVDVPIKNKFNTIVEYQALDGIPSYSSFLDYTQVGNLDNYGGETDTMAMTDYKEAFTPAKPIDLDSIEEPEVKSIEQLQKERERDNTILEDRLITGITWGHSGIVDEKGNRLKNLLRLKF